MNMNIMHFSEEQRLAREAMREAITEAGGVTRCSGCGAFVTIQSREVINEPCEIIGECRCLCGLVWEVELAA
jgi:hypothetical protein